MGFFDFFRRKKEKPAEQKLEPVKENRTDRPFEQKPQDLSQKRENVHDVKRTPNRREGFRRKKRPAPNRKGTGSSVGESVAQTPAAARPTHHIRKQNHQRPAKKHYGHINSDSTARNYTVKAGDSLSRIAKDFYGDPNEWQKIYQANRGRIKDPNIIHAGQVLIIP